MASRMPYGMPTDLFSIGCTLYFMFRKRPPFRTSPHSTTAVLNKTIRCKFQFDVWFDDVSEACKRMISSLVVRKPAGRLSIELALQHDWLAPSDFSSRTLVGSGASSSDEEVGQLSKHDAVVALARGPHQRSVSATCVAELSSQSLQDEVRHSSDAQHGGKNGMPQAGPSRSRMSRKPEPRRPNGNPLGPKRFTFDRHTGESCAQQHTEPDSQSSQEEDRTIFDAQQFGKHGTSQASAPRSEILRKPEPRRPNGNPLGHVRPSFRSRTGESFVDQHTEPDVNSFAAGALDSQ
eukprot:TRINITY_DN3471_c0_g1_i1.p1 TRINITY_DN3471_c0_g1~~TRINITY_DN3471_c0_g1_i1.p1  ORF type:complete len:300 (-),score=22.70 TRINITY_DN3471_c0_g1_i1:351-1226(-)